MTIQELRHHAWNYLMLAKSAELHAIHATSEAEIDMWNEAVSRNLDTSQALEAAADRMENTGLPFRKAIPSVPARQSEGVS